MRKIKIYKIPFNLTLFAIFIPILIHLLSFEFATYFHLLTLAITGFFIKKETRYAPSLVFFVSVWLLICILHLVNKGDIVVFGYMQSFFYGVCFYLLLQNNAAEISGKELVKNMQTIYGVLFVTLVVEMVINFLRLENIMVALFSGKSVGKSYQILTSRILDTLLGYNLTSLNSIFFGPQSASMIIFMCMLFYEPFDKLTNRNYKIRFLVCLVMFMISNTMTVSICFVIFLLHFIFLSRNSSLNKPIYKIILAAGIFFAGSVLLTIFFNALQADLYLDLYLYKWTQPVKDLSLFSTRQLWFGLPTGVSLDSYTDSWEFGAVQSIFLVGVMPIIFLVGLCIFFFVKLFYWRGKAVIYMSESNKLIYQSVRLSVFIVCFCVFSLIHYAAIFSTGFFQLIGLHIGIAFYGFGQLRVMAQDLNYAYNKKLR